MSKPYWFLNSITFILAFMGMIIFFAPTKSFAYNTLIQIKGVRFIYSFTPDCV